MPEAPITRAYDLADAAGRQISRLMRRRGSILVVVGLLALLPVLVGCAEGDEPVAADEDEEPVEEPEPEPEEEPEPDDEPEPQPQEDAEDEPEPEPEDAQIELRINVSDETSAWESGTSGLPDLEVWVRGTGSWFPDTSFGGDTLEDAGPFPVGEETEFAIYPDGRDGTEIMVEVLVDEDMIAGSPRDAIDITIDDTTVNVFGTPIPGFEVEFER